MLTQNPDILGTDSSSAPVSAQIAVVIVNYGTAELACEAVESVLRQSNGNLSFQIHLVDNASPGGTDAQTLTQAHTARDWGEAVVLHLEDTNHGFGRGNNVVLKELEQRATAPKYAFLLNPDAQLDNDVIKVLAETLDANPQAGFAGAAIQSPEGVPATAAFRFPRPIAEFTRQLSFGPLDRLVPHWAVPLPPDHPEGPVDWVAGAAVMMRMSALKELGFFDPAYFLYYEEVDLMHRAQRAGWQTLYVPKARVIHIEGAATNVRSGASDRPRRPAYWYQSWRTYFRSLYGRGGLVIAALAWLLGAIGNLALSLIPRRQSSVPRHYFKDVWALVWRPMLGLKEGVVQRDTTPER